MKRLLLALFCLFALTGSGRLLPHGSGFVPAAGGDPLAILSQSMAVGDWVRLDVTGTSNDYTHVFLATTDVAHYNGAANDPFPDTTTPSALAATLGCQHAWDTLQFSTPHIAKNNGKVFTISGSGHGHACNMVMSFDLAAGANYYNTHSHTAGGVWTEPRPPTAYAHANNGSVVLDTGCQPPPSTGSCPPTYSNQSTPSLSVGGGFWSLKQNTSGPHSLDGDPGVCPTHTYNRTFTAVVSGVVKLVTGGAGCNYSPTDSPGASEIWDDSAGHSTLCWTTQTNTIQGGTLQATFAGFAQANFNTATGSVAFDDHDGGIYSLLTLSQPQLYAWPSGWATCYGGGNNFAPPVGKWVALHQTLPSSASGPGYGGKLVIFQDPANASLRDAFQNVCPTQGAGGVQAPPCSSGNAIFVRDIENTGSQNDYTVTYTTSTCMTAFNAAAFGRQDLMGFAEARARASIVASIGDAHLYEIVPPSNYLTNQNWACNDLGVGSGGGPVAQSPTNASGVAVSYLESYGLVEVAQVDDVNDTLEVWVRRVQ